MNYCDNSTCKQPIPTTASFCPHCGRKQQGVSSVTSAPKSDDSKMEISAIAPPPIYSIVQDTTKTPSDADLKHKNPFLKVLGVIIAIVCVGLAIIFSALLLLGLSH